MHVLELSFSFLVSLKWMWRAARVVCVWLPTPGERNDTEWSFPIVAQKAQRRVYLHIDRPCGEHAVRFKVGSPWVMFRFMAERLYPGQRDYYGGITLKWHVKRYKHFPEHWLLKWSRSLLFLCEDNRRQQWEWLLRHLEIIYPERRTNFFLPSLW